MTTCPKFPLRLKTVSAIVLVSITLGGLVGCGGGGRTATVAPPPLIGAGETTGSKVLSWFSQIADSLYEVAKGVAAIGEGHVVAGVSEFAAAGLGLIGKGLESGDSGDDQARQLTKIDSKLDTVIVGVQSIATQVSTIEGQVKNMDAWQKNNAAMSDPMTDAQTWLDTYYTNPNKAEQSREWVRWYMAGCDPAKVTSCPSASNPAIAANLARFRDTYMHNADTKLMTDSTDNFPLWWAYGVVNNQTTGGPKYEEKGSSADDLVTNIYQGLTNYPGLDTNGLISYMNYVMTQDSSHCGSDVTDPQCDLYNNVYVPLEAYFSLAIGRQSQLVMALAEAKTVLAQKYPDAHGQDGNSFMADFKQKLNLEVEAFLQAAEQIALYRAADGRTDWNNFADTDAGKLLARADFIVAKLAGKYYRTATTIPAWTDGYVNPPWPSNGIVGRVFYANGEPKPTGTRMLALDSTVGPQYQPFQTLSEDDTSVRTVPGVVQPYLVWTRSVDAKGVVTMTGTANTQWSVRRLVAQPITLPMGLDFQVTSSQPTRSFAKLGLYNYDENFVTPPGPGTSSVIPFGSFSSVEGNIGGAGLTLDPSKMTANMNPTLYDASYNASTVHPGAVSLSVTYVPNEDYKPETPDAWGGKGKTAGTWSVVSTAVKLVIPSASATSVKISWPSAVNVNLDSHFRKLSGLGGDGAGRDEYYSYVKFQQQILDSKGKVLTGGSVINEDCTSSPFLNCQIDKSQSVDLTMLTADATAANLSFAAHFSTEVEQYNEKLIMGSKYATVRSSIKPSVASWQIQAPVLTLIK